MSTPIASDHIDYFLPYQADWINQHAPLALMEKSRRIGLTYASSYRAVERRVSGTGNLYFSSADYTAGREFIDYCRTWCQVFNAVADFTEGDETVPVEDSTTGAIIDERKIHTMNLTFANGCKIVAGSSNPTFFRSKGGDADGDEFAFHRDGRELLKAMHATALFWGHELRLWSTHNGQASYFNQILKQVRAGEMKAQVHRVTILDAVEQGLVEKIKKLKRRDDKARQEWLDELRSTCPDEAIWREEYLCEPSTDAGSLLTYEQIQACEVENLQLWEDLAAIPQDRSLFAGFDVGRKKDLSVLWVNETVGDVHWCRVLRRLKDVNFTAQEELLALLLANRSLKRICIDRSGLGWMLAERLQQRFGSHRVEMVNFTAQSKSDMAMPLVRRFQDRTQRIPMDPKLREALHSVRKLVTAAGNVRLDAEHTDDGHADEFWAGALACEASDPNRAPLPAPMLAKPEGW